jgi:serine/threonine protein kinase
MIEQPADCSQIDLSSLFIETDGPGDDPAILAHLETCPGCQKKLQTLAASNDWWHDCRMHLSSAETDEADLPAADLYQALSPPSHPEMLGRIGRYEVEKLLGRGGMGVVFKAFDSELNRPVAIKVLAPHLAGSGAARKRFGREARAAAAIVHEQVVAIHDVEVGATSPYLVMQYVPGESLQSYVDREGPLEACDLIRIGHQIAAGLAAAHSQCVVHRDIKPGNIMLENGLGRVVITDFGLARAADDASLTHSGIVAGTPHYMSPEQARGEPTDERSDQFSLGAVLYFMATGHPPFRAEQAMAVLHRICHDQPRPVRQINPSIPDELARLIERLLEKKPGRRFADASEAQQALTDVLNNIQQPRRWRFSRTWDRLHRRRWYFLSAAAAVCLAISAVAALLDWQRPGNSRELEVNQTSSAAVTKASQSNAGQTQQTAAREPDFATEVAALNERIKDIAEKPFPETEAIKILGNQWTEELNSMLRIVMRLETVSSFGDSFTLPFTTSIGEKR